MGPGRPLPKTLLERIRRLLKESDANQPLRVLYHTPEDDHPVAVPPQIPGLIGRHPWEP